MIRAARNGTRGLSSAAGRRKARLLPASLPGPLVSTSWLANHLPSVKVLDCSYFATPALGNGSASFLECRVPGSTFFDIDYVADKESELPHMLPSVEEFDRILGGEMGISVDDNIVVYDCQGMFSAPRVWHTLRAFGATKVGVLSGGLPLWRREHFATASGPGSRKWAPTSSGAKLNTSMVATYEDVLRNIDTGDAIVVDARSHGRFEGIEPEPREGMKPGHIPGSRNIPFGLMYNAFSQTMLSAGSLKATFARAGVDLSDRERPIITTCGSGVTASVLALGLHVAGHTNVSVYDGSWAEWGMKYDSPVETGPPRPLK